MGGTVAPPALCLTVQNLQGLGAREEQQDAFGMTPLEQAETGFLAVLADGMGGLQDGGRIAAWAVRACLALGGGARPEQWEQTLTRLDAEIFGACAGGGGTTLLVVDICSERLRFWSLGDSDLFLWRAGELTRLTRRQEKAVEMLTQVWEGRLSWQGWETDPERGALTDFLGSGSAAPDKLCFPFSLRADDVLLLCSDGVTDTLSEPQLCAALEAPDTAAELEKGIEQSKNSAQDNYTAIILRLTQKEEL